MKKMNILKIAFTLVLAISMSAVFGQIQDVNVVDNGATFTMTVGSEVPFNVAPDSYFNPNYNAGGLWAVSSDFLWSFSVNPASFSFDDATSIAPDITIGTIGSYTLNVLETAAGGCPSGSGTSVAVEVIDVPDVNFPANPADACEIVGVTSIPITIENNGASAYNIDWTLDVDELSFDQATVLSSLAQEVNTDDAFALADTELDSRVLTTISSHVTRYTYTITGINDAVSRVSDYIPVTRDATQPALTEYTPQTKATYVVVILPAPTTGIIYHLSN